VRPPTDAVRILGEGPDLLLIHGTAADKSSWNALARRLQHRFRIIAYDRRGTGAWPLAAEAEPPSIEDHATDAAEIVRDCAAGAAFVCGVSLGAVVALELMRRRADLVRGTVIFEPPLPSSDDLAMRRSAFLIEFERLVGEGRGEEAAELFQRRLLSDAFWERLPAATREKQRRGWRPIYCDLVANAAYRPRYEELGRIDIPIVLLDGHPRSAFEPSLRALAAALPRSCRKAIAAPSHRLAGRAWQDLAAVLIELAADSGS
jgi:pimeloyl-ACP methyl ester carboxylesterase